MTAAEDAAKLLIEGVQTGDLDAYDMEGIITDFKGWVIHSETYTASQIRAEAGS